MRFRVNIVLCFLVATCAQSVASANNGPSITLGAERLINECLHKVKDKNVALVANQSSCIKDTHLVDLLRRNGVHVKKILVPEHGFRGQQGASEPVADERDKDIEIISLYKHNSKKVTAAMLEGIDLVVFDLQDVGVRFYTYISTLHYVMEGCAEFSKLLLVLDRPNPHAHCIDGPVLEREMHSFIGMHPIPLVYGLTIGELAHMINGEGWLRDGMKCDLEIIPLGKDYTHKTPYELPIKPSPNLPNKQAVALYPSLGLFEGTTMSVGRGTDFPFQALGHPDKSSNQGQAWGTFHFIPTSTEACLQPKYEGQTCYGIDLRKASLSSCLNVKYLLQFYKVATQQGVPFFGATFDIHAGNKQLRKQIEAGLSEKEIRASWQPALDKYKAIRTKYLLYAD
jgi:uncharacterized protein YbbC (DUF1343 family)